MRVNVYAEEMTDKVEIITKKRDMRVMLRKALDLLDKHYAVKQEGRGTPSASKF